MSGQQETKKFKMDPASTVSASKDSTKPVFDFRTSKFADIIKNDWFR
jgi:hypothetical protein